MQSGNGRAVALFGHLMEGACLNKSHLGSSIEDRDANGNEFNVFASDREIIVTDADAGPALRTQLMQEIQYSIMKYMELLTERTGFAIDFWANPIAQSLVLEFNARTLQTPEVTRNAEISMHHALSNNLNRRNDGYNQNLQFQISLLYKLAILHVCCTAAPRGKVSSYPNPD
ncbi:MAG: hypothetical protein EZS28_037757, partial [Streblomastix strix]